MAELPSPLTPEINTLLEQALVDFRRYGVKLFQAIMTLIQGGRGLPLTEATRSALETLYRDHDAELVGRFAGGGWDPQALQRLVKTGRLSPEYLKLRGPSTLNLLYRVGKAYPVAEVPRDRGQSVGLKAALKAAKAAPLTTSDLAALNYVRQRGAAYMRRPMAAGHAATDRALTEAEFEAVGGPVVQSIMTGSSFGTLAKDLRDATQGTKLTNDMERGARTEGMFVVHAGALATLKDKAKTLGTSDPQVYKLVSPGACRQCVRIWGPMNAPLIYRLSEIEGQSNFGRKQSEWVATIGPSHPRCTCPPLMLWFPKQHERVMKTVDAIMERY